jgi:hypothetical protein
VYDNPSTAVYVAAKLVLFMYKYYRFLHSYIITFFVMSLVQSSAFAQSSGSEGEDIAAPWTMGNILVVLFAIGLFALTVRSSRRDLSAIPDEYGKRPNPKDLKKKKGKQKPDFSKGPIKHPDLEGTTTQTIVAFFLPFLMLFSLPKAIRVRDEIKGDPRFLGEGTARTLVILHYVALGVWALIIVIVAVVGILLAMSGGGG